ncbi:hypothetical protein C1701_20315 [Actinoalloteichus sp. AHMU CJ021]|uniref:Uncharacterized protein n=1 Tax=Actinoalloteichus caeruleus DSM 43889 TaxID=1120930 RepID=A0ABT1JQK5_ACTCY|nr:hypothetical protein [Actinoalloteichus caeruleus]AUS80287.1 hypothetical protein C1701_20315 [Actinoalloteichus sp. AHMU CJ021]MCP2334534.1 hypothetical protein [Actinoalloteichus caeruleus DSM 43889]
MTGRRYRSVRPGRGSRFVALLLIVVMTASVGQAVLVNFGLSLWEALAVLLLVIAVPAAVVFGRNRDRDR